MSTKRIRAIPAYKFSDEELYGKVPSGRCGQKFYVLPATAEAYEQMVEQMAKALSAKWTGTYTGDVGVVLRAIGITPPKKGRA